MDTNESRLLMVRNELRELKGGIENAMGLAAKVQAPADKVVLDALLWRLDRLKDAAGTALTLSGEQSRDAGASA